MGDFLQVHHLTEDANTHEVKIVRTTPYLRIKGAGPTPLFLKGGRVCDENGHVVKEVPAWLREEMQKCTDAALKEVGFDPLVVRKMDDVGGDEKQPDTETPAGDPPTEAPPVQAKKPVPWSQRRNRGSAAA